jgi:predicted enzyme involved in methoxymalonyl-ACP biosynthesis
MIAFIADVARQKKARVLIGEFIPTAKNKQAKEIYKKYGLVEVSETRFVGDLENHIFHYSPHIRVIS